MNNAMSAIMANENRVRRTKTLFDIFSHTKTTSTVKMSAAPQQYNQHNEENTHTDHDENTSSESAPAPAVPSRTNSNFNDVKRYLPGYQNKPDRNAGLCVNIFAQSILLV